MSRSLLPRLAIASLFVLLFGLVILLALPHIVNRLLLPPLLEKLASPDSEAVIATITTSSASGSIELDHQQKVLVSLPKLTISYSPASLLKAKLKALTIEHGVFHLYQQDGAWEIPGYLGTTSGSESAQTALGLPIGIDSVVLKQCRLVVHDPDKGDLTIGISGELNLSFHSLQRGPLESIQASLALSGDIASRVSLSVVFKDQQIRIQSSVTDAQIPSLKRVFPGPAQDIDFGSVSADLNMVADDFSFSKFDYRLNGSLTDLSYAANGVEISTGTATNTFSFLFSGNRSQHRCETSSLQVEAPINARLTISGDALLDSKKLSTTGVINALPALENPANPNPIPAMVNFSAEWTQANGLALEAETKIQPEGVVHIPEKFTGSPASIELEELRLATQLKSQNEMFQARLSLRSSPIKLRHGADELLAEGLEFNGTVRGDHDWLDARIDGSLSHLTLPEKKISVDGLHFNLPVAPIPGLPSASRTEQTGTIALNEVSFNGAPLASLSTDIKLSSTVYRIDGRLKSPIIRDEVVHLNGTAALSHPSAALSWELGPIVLDAEAFQAYRVLEPDIDFEARLEASGEIRLNGSEFSGRAQTAISDGTVQLRDKEINLQGIDCGVEFPELPRLISHPGQRCTISRAEISSLSFGDAAFIFRLEDPPALFIEKSVLKWCGGTLDSGSLRHAIGAPEIDTVFFGSQINLGQLLEQFGFKISEGEGSLNGKLPVRINRETIEFDGGFLFSTPGTGGIVRFTDTDLLRQGIGGVSEAGSINYALQALEDFSYNWTKLSFNTSGDELLLALELDGKPRTALPFKLNKNGMIVQSTKGAGLQYPIRLDVNVRLPLGELFKVGQSVNSIMENNQ